MNKTKGFRQHISYLMLLLSPFIFSCKSRKIVTTDHQKVYLDYKSPKTLTALLKKNELKYTTISAKYSAEVTIDSASHSFTVNMRGKKDSVIWVTLSKIGLTGARAIVTKDSVRFRTDMDKKHFRGNYNYINKLLHAELDYEILESLLIGNSVEFYDDEPRMKSGIDDKKYFLGTIRKRKMKKVIEKGKELKDPAQSIWLDPVLFKIVKIQFRDPNTNRSFEANYENFTLIDSMYVPMKITYNIKAEKHVTIVLEYSKISLNKELDFPYSVPEDYEPIIYLDPKVNKQGK